MRQEVQDALVDFEAALRETNTGLSAFLQLLSGLIDAGAGQFSYALMRHAQDVLGGQGSGDSPDYPSLIAEAYRRVFCEPGRAGMYGMDADSVGAANIVPLLTSMSAALRYAASSTEEERGQISLALDADTGNCH